MLIREVNSRGKEILDVELSDEFMTYAKCIEMDRLRLLTGIRGLTEIVERENQNG
jgi:hypothetical protein